MIRVAVRLIVRILPLLFVSLLALACQVLGQATPTPTPTVPATPTDVPATPDPARYVNEQGGFSLILPQGWTAIGPQPVGNDPARPYDLYILGQDPAPSGGPGSSQIAILDAAQWTAEDFVLSQCSTCPAGTFEDVTLGGVPARRTQVGGGGVPFMVTWHFVEHDGKLIALAIHDPESLEPLDEVLQSFQID